MHSSSLFSKKKRIRRRTRLTRRSANSYRGCLSLESYKSTKYPKIPLKYRNVTTKLESSRIRRQRPKF
jgi:hypothetical protein